MKTENVRHAHSSGLVPLRKRETNKMTKYPDIMIRGLIDMWREGRTWKEIGDATGMWHGYAHRLSREYVSKHPEEAWKLEERPKLPSKSLYSEETVLEWKRMKDSGMKYREISAAVGVNHTYICKRVKEL